MKLLATIPKDLTELVKFCHNEIKGKPFTDCLIVGKGVVMVTDGIVAIAAEINTTPDLEQTLAIQSKDIRVHKEHDISIFWDEGAIMLSSPGKLIEIEPLEYTELQVAMKTIWNKSFQQPVTASATLNVGKLKKILSAMPDEETVAIGFRGEIEPVEICTKKLRSAISPVLITRSIFGWK